MTAAEIDAMERRLSAQSMSDPVSDALKLVREVRLLRGALSAMVSDAKTIARSPAYSPDEKTTADVFRLMALEALGSEP